MTHKIWLMEGLSSQRDLILGIRAFAHNKQTDVTIIASHRSDRHEILDRADIALIEPPDADDRLAFILSTVKKLGIKAIHTGRHAHWFEAQREAIAAYGAALTTGARQPAMFELADDKVEYAHAMEKAGLPVVPSLRVGSADELRSLISRSPFSSKSLCVKPVKGIYGRGFWRFDESVSPMAAFAYPDSRKVNTRIYLNALEQADEFEPLVLMPWLPGPEYSVDMLVEEGDVLAAVGRRKEGPLQYLENQGEAFELAKACARVMNADGLVNVQTRNNANGKPLLLEINMRPSGGIGYCHLSGVNLPGLFAFRQLGLMSQQAVRDEAQRAFKAAIIRPITEAVNYAPQLTNLYSEGDAHA